MSCDSSRIIKVMVLSMMVVFWAVGCNVNSKPEVNLTTEIVKLTDEDYNSVGTTNITNPNKSDFRKFNFSLKVNNLNDVKKRTITVPRLESGVNSYDNQHRLWFGSSAEQDNLSEDFAFYERKYMLFTRGLNEADLRKMFEDKIVTIEWETNEGEVVNKQFDVGRTIIFR